MKATVTVLENVWYLYSLSFLLDLPLKSALMSKQ